MINLNHYKSNYKTISCTFFPPTAVFVANTQVRHIYLHMFVCFLTTDYSCATENLHVGYFHTDGGATYTFFSSFFGCCDLYSGVTHSLENTVINSKV